jgi:hypothetical protein
LLLSLLIFAAATLGAPLQTPAGSRDPLDELTSWVARNDNPQSPPDTNQLSLLVTLVADVRMTQVVVPARRPAALLVLLDLAAFAPRLPTHQDGRSYAPRTAREQASDLGFDALEHALDLDLLGACTWLATEVLSQPATQPAPRRRAALDLLRSRHEPITLIPIMSSARDDDRGVRDAAMTALEGWDDDGVHRFMLQQLERGRTRRAWISNLVVYRHFARVKLDPEGSIAKAVRDYAQREATSEDWRQATGGVRLLAALDDANAIPVLIESLSQWLDRRALGQGSKRVEGDIERNLRLRTGSNLGLHPDRWARWWRSRAGGTSAHDPEPNAVTRAGFFGLHPWTDRVVFVIDRSGSMAGRFHSSGDGAPETSRYAEALRQMNNLLRDLGPQTKFRVVLFESSTHVWRDTLQIASDANREAAQHWCEYQNPDGGTALRSAIEEVMRLDKKGEPDLKRLEEDTVIVLCDGETQDGSNWVRPLLERVNGEACLVFHCVQIGSAGDGSLQRLAELSGGEFVQVDG